MNNFQKSCYKRTQNRSFACSDELWNEILRVTKGAISVSAFIRRCVKKELKELEKYEEQNGISGMD